MLASLYQLKITVEKLLGSWIGKITEKAFIDALKIASANAPAILTHALCYDFDIPI